MCGRANPENRILQKTQEVRQTIQDRLTKVAWKEEETLPQAPVFHEFLESIFFNFLKSFFGRRVRSWLRTNAGGAPNTCKSRG